MRQSISSGKCPAVVFFLILSIGMFAGLKETYAQQAEKYPARPIDFIVPWGPGGGADQLARKVAHLMEPVIGVSIPVVNVPGASGRSGLVKLLAHPADGYGILVFTVLFGSDNEKINTSDFLPLAIMTQQPSGFFVKADAPWKTWAELEKAARTKVIKVANTGFGSPDNITIDFIASKGLKLLPVPYAKPGERYTSVIGGHADLLYEQAGDVRTFIDSKQMRPILFFSDKRVSAFPDIPVSTELGYDITLPQFRAIVMKTGTDPKRVKIISEALGKVAASPGFKDYLREQYAEEDSYVPLQNAQKYLDTWIADAERVMAVSSKKK